MRTLLIVATLVLASIAVAPTAAADHCFPDEGPFDRCHWLCAPGWEYECGLIITTGGTLWSKTVCRNGC